MDFLYGFSIGGLLIACASLFYQWQQAEWKIEQLERALWTPKPEPPNEYDFALDELFDE